MLKAGIIGVGRRGGHHLKSLQNRSDVKVVAICDIDPEVQKKVDDSVSFYQDYQEFLAKEDLDMVVVATPTRLHADHAVASLEKGCHVLCEKPLAWSLAEALRIVDAAEKSKGYCEIGFQWRHYSSIPVAREALAKSGIALARGLYYHCTPLVDSIKDKNTGGGQVFDQVIHLVDLARFFAGNVREVTARYTLNARSAEEFDNWDGYALTFTFDSGTVGSFASTYALFLGHGDVPTLDLIGREVLVRFSGGKLIVKTPEDKKEYGPNSEEFERSSDLHGDFIEAIKTGNTSLLQSPPQDALRTLATVIAANESARTGKSLDPEELIAKARQGEDTAAV